MRSEITMPEVQLVTADELTRVPENGRTYELVQGRLIGMSKPGVLHGLVGTRLFSPLARFVEAHRLGVVLPQDTGFLLTRNPDTVRGPDLSFVTRARLESVGLAKGFWPGAPDLAVEVASPNDRWQGLVEKAAEYLRHGARLVWVINPEKRLVVVFRANHTPLRLTESDVLDGADVVPGFQLPVGRLFDAI
jgi:Uma2 family endonuclease